MNADEILIIGGYDGGYPKDMHTLNVSDNHRMTKLPQTIEGWCRDVTNPPFFCPKANKVVLCAYEGYVFEID